MAANLFNRYIWLVDIILRTGEHGITLEEINRRWSQSRYNETGDSYPERTFHRHRNAIEEMFDIDIKCNKHTGRYTIANADDMNRGGVRTWLLNTFAVNNLINESHHLKRRILFEEIPSGQRFLTAIIEAMRDGLVIMLTYKSFNSDQEYKFEVQPYCVKVFKQRWYMVAYNPYYDDSRIYALDRINDVETTETRFTLPKDFDAKKYFADAFGIIIDDDYDVERVEVKVMSGQREYFQTLPLHPSQTIIKDTDDYTVYSFRLRPTFDFVQELRRYGADLEVLSPRWLREEFAEEAARMAEIYTRNPSKIR